MDDHFHSQDEQTVGWISFTDVLLLSTVVLFVGAMVAFGATRQSEGENDDLKIELKDLLKQIKDLRAEWEELEERNRAMTAKNESLLTENSSLEKDNLFLKELNEKLRGQIESEGKLRQELLELRGDLGKVVFVVDRSQSMEDDGRWETTQKIISTWLELLPVKEAALVTFNHDVEIFPRSGQYLPMQVKGNSELLTDRLAQLRPEGYTHTLSALERAYAVPGVDTIVLFTDGDPDTRNKNIGRQETREAVMAMLKQKKREGSRVVINVVGLGAYYGKPEFVQFLLEIADVTNGSYRAR